MKYKLHTHPKMEQKLNVDDKHCIIDRDLFEFLIKKIGYEIDDLTIEKRIAIQEIKDFLEEHPIALINEEGLMKWSLSEIKSKLEDFKKDLIQ